MENFLDRLNQIALQLTEWVWGIPLIVLLLAVGILLSVRMHFLQLRQLPRALKFMVQNEEGGSGEVSSFGALCTALSATIGTGNIVGVATAILLGGPGALFWMWVAAFFGMATKYAEGLLAVKYRTVDADGHVLGGAFYYIERGIAERFPKWKGSARVLAVLFAVFGAGAGLLGIGAITQVNGIASAIQNLTDPEKAGMVVLFGHSFGFTWTTLIVAVVTALLVGLVIIGGIRRISNVSQVVVPFMACAYVLICIVVLIVNAKTIPNAFVEIFQGAFGLRAAAGGAVGAMFLAMQKGIARGMLSNESGLGSASIAAAAAKTGSAARQGLVTMTGTFIDTLVICTMTGLAILSTGSHQTGLVRACRKDREARHGTDDKSIDKGARHCDQPLPRSRTGFGCSGRNRRRAQTGFIGKHPTRDPFLHCQKHGSYCTAGRCTQTERPLKNLNKCIRNRLCIHDQNHNADQNIGTGHKRDNDLRNVGNPANAADDDQPDQQRRYNGHDQRRPGKTKGMTKQNDHSRFFRICQVLYGRRDPVDLSNGADTEQTRTRTENGKQNRQHTGRALPFRKTFCNSALDVIKRSSQHMAVGIYGTVFDRQQTFGVLCSHAKKRCDPHPEQRARTAEQNGGCNTHNISRSDCGRKRRAERTEAGNLSAAAFFILNHEFQRTRKLTQLQKMHSDRKQDPDRQQQHNQRNPPDPFRQLQSDLIQPIQKIFHFSFPLLFGESLPAPEFSAKRTAFSDKKIKPNSKVGFFEAPTLYFTTFYCPKPKNPAIF